MPVNTYAPNTDQVEAVVFNPGSLAEAQIFAGGALVLEVVERSGAGPTLNERSEWHVNTLDGLVPIRNGNLLVKGPGGDFYPMHAGEFHKRWKQV